jgi:hypothetical protein
MVHLLHAVSILNEAKDAIAIPYNSRFCPCNLAAIIYSLLAKGSEETTVLLATGKFPAS